MTVCSAAPLLDVVYTAHERLHAFVRRGNGASSIVFAVLSVEASDMVTCSSRMDEDVVSIYSLLLSIDTLWTFSKQHVVIT